MKNVFVFSGVLLLLFFQCQTPNKEDGNISSTLEPGGVVSSAHPFATEAGLQILKQGGNAFDAAVTIAATLNVVEPMMSGAGGYGTILIYDAAKKKVRFLDSSGKIPLNTNSDLMRPPTPDYLQNRRGAKAVSTPGNVNAWNAMSKEYGILEWGNLFGTPIKLAEEGFVITPGLGRFINSAYSSFSPYSKSIYGNEMGPLQSGDTLIQKDLSGTFRIIADGGPSAFYNGEIGKAIDKKMQEEGGFLAYQDLQADKAEWWDPIKIDYRGDEVYTASPPSTAFPSLVRLGLMQKFENLNHNSAEYLHRFAEATKFAYLSRLTYAGDPEIKPPPIDMLLSDQYLSQAVSTLDLEQATDFIMPESNTLESKNTTHFVVADKWGNIVSATQTLGNLFGSRLMPEGTGLWLNNSLAYCTYEPKGNPMDAIPGQRKLSGDCPTIIFREGKPWVALGTPGGHTIGQTVPQMVMNLIDFEMPLDEAVNAARVSFIEPNGLAVEYGVSEEVFVSLQEMGHQVFRVKALGNGQALEIVYSDDGQIVNFKGASDKRGEGMAGSM